MTTSCERLRWSGTDAMGSEELAGHLARCPHCRAQVEVDAMLRSGLGSLRGGEVPAGLDTRTMRRLQQCRPTLGPAQRRLLGVYWTVASLSSALVLLSLDPRFIGPVAAAMLLFATATALLPAVPLLRHVLGHARAGP